VVKPAYPNANHGAGIFTNIHFLPEEFITQFCRFSSTSTMVRIWLGEGWLMAYGWHLDPVDPVTSPRNKATPGADF